MIAHSELQRILFLILAEGTWLPVSGRLVAGYTRTVILLYKEFTGTLIGIEQSAAFCRANDDGGRGVIQYGRQRFR